MKVLLDTNAFIWWDSNAAKLSAKATTVLRDPANSIYLSVVSVWEILIKQQLRKLALKMPLPAIVAQQQANGIQILPVTLDHVLKVEGLPPHNKDPFDRLLVAQAQIEGAVIISSDTMIAKYPVQIIW